MSCRWLVVNLHNGSWRRIASICDGGIAPGAVTWRLLQPFDGLLIAFLSFEIQGWRSGRRPKPTLALRANSGGNASVSGPSTAHYAERQLC